MQTSGRSCRENVAVYLLFEIRIKTPTASLRGASAEARLRAKADATIAVGTLISERPPHRTVQAAFPHTAPTLGV